jgi:hypothetical protein
MRMGSNRLSVFGLVRGSAISVLIAGCNNGADPAAPPAAIAHVIVASLGTIERPASAATALAASSVNPPPVAATPPVAVLPAAAAAAAPRSAPQSATAATQPLTLQVTVPTAAANSASYVSPATRSLRLIVNGAAQVAPVGNGAPGCTAAATGYNCVVTVSVPAGAAITVTAQGFASADGSGTPLEMTPPGALPVPSTPSLTPTWVGVVATLKATLSGPFAAGEPSTASLAITALDAAGYPLPASPLTWVDVTGAPLAVILSDADASGSTELAGAVYAGTPVTLSYDGDLPLPNPITVTATPTSSLVAPAAVTMAQPTASKSFTVSFGPALIVPNNTGIPGKEHDLDIWNATPDSKFAVVNQGAQTLFSWGNGAGVVFGNSPYPELIQGSSINVYTSPAQTFESRGVWLRDILPVSHPYHPSNTQELITFYHAESDWTGPHTKTVGVSYSHDGGRSWTAGSQILTPNAYTSGVGISSADEGAIYDPVNKRWVIMFTAIDPSPNISGHLSEAVSSDPLGAPGTWFKLYNGAFTQPGLQGQETSLPAVQGQGYISSPCVSWNSYLNEWVMIADWGGVGEALMTSTDLINWSTPVKLMDGKNLGFIGGWSAYPTLIGSRDDKITEQTSHLYFAEFSDSDPRIYGRVLLEQALTFHRND